MNIEFAVNLCFGRLHPVIGDGTRLHHSSRFKGLSQRTLLNSQRKSAWICIVKELKDFY
jgi:hypothetical protein